jgi:hypothetical protein
MLSSVRPPTDLVAMKYNMVWDGLVHAFTWTMVSLGLWRLWVAGKRTDVAWSPRTFAGSLVLGWGLFNFVEGMIDHQLLGISRTKAWPLRFSAHSPSSTVPSQMAELRAISTRAEITPTRFWNKYQWVDLNADPAKLVDRYFDAHIYFANWGTHRLTLRVPAKRVDVKALRVYFVGDAARRG